MAEGSLSHPLCISKHPYLECNSNFTVTAHVSSAQPATQRCHRLLYFYFPLLFSFTSTTETNLKPFLENLLICRISTSQSVTMKLTLVGVFHVNTSSIKYYSPYWST